MANSRRLIVEIIGDSSSLEKAFLRSSKATQKFSVGIGTLVKSAVVFGGVAAAARGLRSAIGSGIDEFLEQQKVAAQTNAVLASTAGIANVTAKQVDRLGDSIQRYSGIDDEAIKSGANLLLTFKNVRNEIGKGNQVFDRATRAAVDLSVAGFGSLSSTSKQLGKALNDPVKGMTALGRAGVTFTASQKATIKALVANNRLLDAQKLILREVESQVGGSARAFGETLPGQLAKTKEAFRNALGGLVGAAAPAVTRALAAFTEFLPSIERGFKRVADVVGPAIASIVGAFTSKLPEIRRVVSAYVDPFRETFLPVLRDVGRLALRIWEGVVDVFSRNNDRLKRIFTSLGETFSDLWTLARPTVVFLFERVLPVAIEVSIRVLEKVAQVVRVLARVFVVTVSTIIKVLDVFLGGLTQVTDAASHLPFIGDQFKGISDRVNSAREGLRGFSDTLDSLDGRQVRVSIGVDITTGRREEGGLGHDLTGGAKAATDKAVEGLKKQTEGTRKITAAANLGKTAAERAAEAAKKQRTAFDRLMDALSLRGERAATTATLQDDLRELATQEKAIRAQIAVEGRTTELERRLFQLQQERLAVRQQQQERLRRQNQAAAAAAKQRQFRLLGLGPEGETLAPTVNALRKQLGSITQAVQGTFLDTNKTRGILARVRAALKDGVKGMSSDVRSAIQQMLEAIQGQLRNAKLDGPLTKTSGLNSKKLADQLGLDPAKTAELRSLLSGFNTAGLALAGASTFGAGAALGAGAGGVTYVLNNPTFSGVSDVEAFERELQKKQRRNPKQKRGPNRIGGI